MKETEASAPEGARQPFELTQSEVELLREALRLLESTLTREEADELAQIQRLLKKLGASPNLRR